MKHLLDIQPIKLPARAVHRIVGGRGQQITAVHGVVWITQANDQRDVILTRGHSFIIDRPGLTVVFALKEARIVVGPAGHLTAAEFNYERLHERAAGCA